MIANQLHLKYVQEFNALFGFDSSIELTKESLGFRLKLMNEEMQELCISIKEYCNDSTLTNKAELAKELADVDYIISGTILSFIIDNLHYNAPFIYKLPIQGNKDDYNNVFIKSFNNYAIQYNAIAEQLKLNKSNLKILFKQFSDVLSETIYSLNQFIILEFGIKKYYDIFELVHKSNISKYYDTFDEAKEYVDNNTKSGDHDIFAIYYSTYFTNSYDDEDEGGKFFVKRNGKLMKPTHYVSPVSKIEQILITLIKSNFF
jgi:hypothetical protein